MRQALEHFLLGKAFRTFIIAVIVFNAIILGMETSQTLMDRFGPLILMLDTICLSIFVIEIVLKLFAMDRRFFKDGWNIFDFAIVAVALMPATQGLSVLRALRILRVLKLITAVPSLKRVVEGLFKALPGMASVFGLMTLIFYIGAVMATKLFGAGCPLCTPEQAANFDEWFGTLGRSGYSLFQIMTLESWSMGIVRPVMDVYPHAWAFFVPFILITTFAVVNLVVGLVVNSMQEASEVETTEATDAYRDEVLDRLKAIEARLSDK